MTLTGRMFASEGKGSRGTQVMGLSFLRQICGDMCGSHTSSYSWAHPKSCYAGQLPSKWSHERSRVEDLPGVRKARGHLSEGPTKVCRRDTSRRDSSDTGTLSPIERHSPLLWKACRSATNNGRPLGRLPPARCVLWSVLAPETTAAEFRTKRSLLLTVMIL